ncbi:MAG TPA: S9 family peptidase [Kineosporiaceae bacterium]|nr:S9 family peptidase [Kineosporiaceae bacterium]
MSESECPPVSHVEPVPEDVYGSWSASPSPDGEHVAFISDRSGEPAVWIQGPSTPRLTKLHASLHRVLTVSWSPDGNWLACYTAAAGSSRSEIYVVHPDGSDLRLVAGAEPGTAELGAGAHHGWSPDGQLVVTETVELESVALLIDPESGERQQIASGPLLMMLDANPYVDRVLLRTGPRGYRSLVVRNLDGTHEQPVVTGVGPGSVDRGCLSADGQTVYARSDVGRELAALVAVDISAAPGAGRPPLVLAERADAELEDIIPAADGGSAVLLWNVHGGTSALSLLDLTSGHQDDVTQLPRDVVDECRFHPGGKALLLTAEDWADPRGVWTIDLASAEATPLSSRADGALRGSRGASATTVEATDLIRPQLRRFASKDGLEVTGWLYRPDAPAPWPTMIHLHGGPEAQERPVYNSLFQSLVAAGIAVFAPNVRGSTGFGRTFGTADDVERRYGAIEDVAASVDHLVETGVADTHRVGCMGRSYGGYLTLAALVWYPKLFAVGIDVCGMADFETFYRHTEPRIAAAAVSKYGHPERDAELLRDLSPIHRIDNLTAPLLVVHGAEDTNVPVEEAQQVVDALAAREIEHRFLLFEGEGHELLATPNRVAFVQAAVGWASHHLGVPALR